MLFDQQILIPDELLEPAATVIEDHGYEPAAPSRLYNEMSGPNKGVTSFPKGIRLKHPDIPDDDPYKFEPIPGYILPLPQSYFGLNIHSTERFLSLVPPLDASNTGILVPKYHTFLEGLVEMLMNPPTGPHSRSWLAHAVFMNYLLDYRMEIDFDADDYEPPPKGVLTPIE